MNGKPTAKAPAVAAKPGTTAKPAPPGAKPPTGETKPLAPGAKPTVGGPRPPVGTGGRPGAGGRNNTVADEENPFDMDMSALQKAIPVAPKPIKGRTVEVKCPMCETLGYITPQQQGKDVKCCNMNCSHPYFTAPLPKKAVVDDGLKKKKGMTIGRVIALVVFGIAFVGFGLWWLVIRIPEEVVVKPPIINPGNPVDDEAERERKREAERQRLEAERKKLMPVAVVRKGAIDQLAKISVQSDTNQTRALRYLAEAYAVSGQVPQALATIKTLAEKAPDSPYFQIEPLVRVYLQQRKTGAADAATHLDAALKAAENLPKSGRAPLDAANALAAALVLENRMPEAQKLIGNGVEGNRADYSMLWTAAIYGDTFDFQVLSEIPAWLAAPNPQHAAVTWVLASWGEYDKSLAWAKSVKTDKSTKMDDAADAALAVWAARIGQDAKSTPEGVQRVEAGLKDASQSGQCRAWTNFAYQRAVAGDTAAAKELMSKADALLAGITVAKRAEMPTIREIHDSEGKERAGLPDASAQRSAALAAANLAVLHLKLGDKTGVEELIGKALDFAEAIAPAAPTVAALKQRTPRGPGLEAELDKLLGLKGNAQRQFTAVNVYMKQLQVLEIEADRRLLFERELIRDIAYRGEPALAWKIVQNRDQIEPAERRSMLSVTPLAYYIAFIAVAMGDNKTADAIGATKPKAKDNIDEMIARLVFNLKTDNFEAVIREMKDLYRAGTYDRDRLDISILRRISQYHTLKGPEKTFKLIRTLPDPQLQEAAVWLMAARAVVEGKHQKLWEVSSPDREQRLMPIVERAALARGLVAGAAALPAEKTAAEGTAK